LRAEITPLKIWLLPSVGFLHAVSCQYPQTVVECLEITGQQLRAGELLEKLKENYHELAVDPPASL